MLTGADMKRTLPWIARRELLYNFAGSVFIRSNLAFRVELGERGEFTRDMANPIP